MDWFLYDNGLHHERVNNQVAAAFVMQKETFKMLSQALQIIKGIIFYSLFCLSNAL